MSFFDKIEDVTIIDLFGPYSVVSITMPNKKIAFQPRL